MEGGRRDERNEGGGEKKKHINDQGLGTKKEGVPRGMDGSWGRLGAMNMPF